MLASFLAQHGGIDMCSASQSRYHHHHHCNMIHMINKANDIKGIVVDDVGLHKTG